jgi:hypothetical protein
MVHPQIPQDLLLLLIYLHSFLLEEMPWGHHVSARSPHAADLGCRPDRLAFKMGPKDLRLFFDSRYGRRSDNGGSKRKRPEIAG